MTYRLGWCLYLCLPMLAGGAWSERIAVIGGGASGIFASIAAAEALSKKGKVIVLEGGPKTLTKVAISGGGRCNVLHDTSKPITDILNGYPRGKKELTGLMNKRFTPTQAQEWFAKRGVTLKTEVDGRMFPITDSSQTIINTLLEAAEQAGVEIRTQEKAMSIRQDSHGNFVVSIKTKDTTNEVVFHSVILATGSSPGGHQLAEELGLTIVKPVPSLFTLNAKHQVKDGGLLYGLSGLSVPSARVTFKLDVPGSKKKKVLEQEGPLLITHHGISGPATLRLSAFGAREFHDVGYRGEVTVHWAPELGGSEQVAEALWKMTLQSPKRTVASSCPLMLSDGSSAIPRRLWSAIALESGFTKETTWGDAPKKFVRKLAGMITECVIHVTGKGVFKDEFVTAGGVSLKELDMRTMESKSCPGLFLCGEVIDVDGVTGGFNFMNCWSTGYVAGTSAAEYVEIRAKEGPKSLM